MADGRSPRDGKFIEELGTYLPRKKGDNFTLDLERAKYWVSKGAQPSETVASFIKKGGQGRRRRLPPKIDRLCKPFSNTSSKGWCRTRTR